MAVQVTVTSPELKRVLERFDGFSAEAKERTELAMGDLWDAFMSEMIGYEQKNLPVRGSKTRSGGKIRLQLSTPGNGLWPVGNRIPRTERYLEHDDGRGKASGRSLRAWHAVLRKGGTEIALRNNTRTPKRVNYAKWAHHIGGQKGDALRLAAGTFTELADMTGKRLARELGDLLRDAG